MTPLALLMLLLVPPPLPPPPPDQFAAAMALWEKVPPTSGERNQAVTAALGALSWATLSEARPYPSGQKQGVAWLARHDRLTAVYRSRLPVDRSRIEREVLLCAAEGLARSFSVDELRQVETFLGTEAGAKFWWLAGTAPPRSRLVTRRRCATLSSMATRISSPSASSRRSGRSRASSIDPRRGKRWMPDVDSNHD